MLWKHHINIHIISLLILFYKWNKQKELIKTIKLKKCRWKGKGLALPDLHVITGLDVRSLDEFYN